MTLNCSSNLARPTADSSTDDNGWFATTAVSTPTVMALPSISNEGSPFAWAAAGFDRPRSRRRSRWLLRLGEPSARSASDCLPTPAVQHFVSARRPPNSWVIRCSRRELQAAPSIFTQPNPLGRGPRRRSLSRAARLSRKRILLKRCWIYQLPYPLMKHFLREALR